MNNATPFGLPEDWVWLLQILIPVTVSALGWIYVHNSSHRILKAEKRTVIKMEAYNSLKVQLYEIEKSFSLLQSFLFITSGFLNQLDYTTEPLLSVIRKNLKDQHDETVFKNAKAKCDSSYLDLILTWEQNEIVFNKLLDQRIALQEEYREIMDLMIWLTLDYDQYFLGVNSGVDDQEFRKKLVTHMNEVNHSVMDFSGCLVDVRENMQNYVFGDIIGEKIGKRIVKDVRYLTIETLMEKHKDAIGQTRKQRT